MTNTSVSFTPTKRRVLRSRENTPILVAFFSLRYFFVKFSRLFWRADILSNFFSNNSQSGSGLTKKRSDKQSFCVPRGLESNSLYERIPVPNAKATIATAQGSDSFLNMFLIDSNIAL